MTDPVIVRNGLPQLPTTRWLVEADLARAAGLHAQAAAEEAELDRLRAVLSECRLFAESVQADERTQEAGLWRGACIPRLLRRIDEVLR